MRLPPKTVALRRSIPIAWKQVRLLQPGKIATAIALSAVNVLWTGHGVLRSSPFAVRLIAVVAICYLVITIAEFLWLLSSGPRFTGFESPTPPATGEFESVDPLVEQLKTLPPSALREETLQLATEMKSFEAGSVREFVATVASPPPIQGAATEAERDEALDRESIGLVERHLLTARAYREQFYRPARALRDELRKRLGIRNMTREPSLPALDDGVLDGAKPITEAANYLAALARRLK